MFGGVLHWAMNSRAVWQILAALSRYMRADKAAGAPLGSHVLPGGDGARSRPMSIGGLGR